MFKLEKVLQNDDSAYIYFTFIIKSNIVILSYYIFSILEKDTIYDILNIEIFLNSQYFLFSIVLSISYLLLSLFLKKRKSYKFNFISYLRQDVGGIVICKIFVFSLFFITDKNFNVSLNYIYSILFLLLNLFLVKQIFNTLYKYMITNNVIQKNIMLVGSFEDIKFFLKQKQDPINIYKCCMISNHEKINLKILKNGEDMN